MKKIIYILLGLIVVAGVIGFFYYRNTIFSKEILKVQILGPEKVNAGDQVKYTVTYKNNGNFVLEKLKISFELPENSITEDGKTLFIQDLKNMNPGDDGSVDFLGTIIGKEGDIKLARASVSYIPQNLSARYESDASLFTTIDSVPITLTYDLPLNIEKGKKITYFINYASDIEYPLENMSIKIDPIRGFNIESATPKSLDNVEWKIGTLNKGSEGKITIKGLVLADSETNFNFSAHLGMWQNGNFVIMKEITQNVQVVQPQLFISELVNGFLSYVASPGETLNYDLYLKNMGNTSFNNIFLISRLEGLPFDFSTLKSESGQIGPNDNMITFDAGQIPSLKKLGSQQEIRLSFSIKLKDSWDFSDINNILKNKVNVSDFLQEFENRVDIPNI